jgi:hypothetical protein
MNLRCLYCQTPFTLSRVEMLSAIVTMNEKNQNHYDAHCPRCRRANSISRQRMELFFPNWREAAKQMAAAPAAPTPASAALKTEPLPKGIKQAVLQSSSVKTTAAAKAAPSASKRKRPGKPASVKKNVPAQKKRTTSPASKTAAKKPAGKTTKPSARSKKK